jgi:hypothetical protein
MPAFITHRNIQIISLQKGESISEFCKPGDIAILEKEDGWWTTFVGEDGELTEYDEPFPSYNKALWTAKAAAEFESE